MKIGAQIGVLASGSTEEAIAKVSNTGLQGIEVFDFNIAPHYKAPELFSRRLHEANVELSGVYFISDNFIDKEKEDLVIDKAEEACLFMKEVGCSHLVLNGGINRKDDYAFTNEDFRQMACIANRLGELCNRMGIRAVLHPHFGCMIETRADLDRLLESGLDRELVGLCVHAAHQLRKGSDPYDIYEKYSGWIRYVHVGDATIDANAGISGALLGEGDLDQRRLMNPILKAGYDGWIVIEAKKEGVDPGEYCKHAMEYLTSQWPTVQWQE